MAAVLRVTSNIIASLSRSGDTDQTFQNLVVEFLSAIARNLSTWCRKAAEQGKKTGNM